MSNFIESVDAQPEKGKVVEWLHLQMSEKCPFLLAFADDGVIWRKWVKGEIKEPPETPDLPKMPELREGTLLQAFVFGAECEVRLFKDELGVWKTLRVVDGDDPELVIKESQILWGDKVTEPVKNGFFYAEEYRAGILGQWLPVERAFDANECARLQIHHLVEFNKETGEAQIALSRLAGLSVGKRAEVVK